MLDCICCLMHLEGAHPQHEESAAGSVDVMQEFAMRYSRLRFGKAKKNTSTAALLCGWLPLECTLCLQ